MHPNRFLYKLTNLVLAVAPIHGVSIDDEANKRGWRIDFKDEATPQQRAAAQQVLDDFDVAAEEEKEWQKKLRREDIEQQARADAVVDKLRNATAQQIVNYVDANVTDFASAKALLAKLALASAYALRND